MPPKTGATPKSKTKSQSKIPASAEKEKGGAKSIEKEKGKLSPPAGSTKAAKAGTDKFSPRPRVSSSKKKQDPETADTKKKTAAAPSLTSLFVQSNFSNLCGVYLEISDASCKGRSSYKNKAGTWLYYLNAGDGWAFAPQLQSKGVFLQVKSEATCPAEIPVDTWGDKVEEIRQIKYVREDDKTVPGRLLVKSNYGNIRGAYDRVADKSCCGRPSYKNKGDVCLYFFEERCLWVFGPELAGASFFISCKSDAATPLELSAEAFPDGGIQQIQELEDVKADQGQPIPSRILLKSNFSNLRGVYTLLVGKEFAGRPSYQNKQNVFLYFLEDVNSWMMGPELGSTGAFTRAEASCVSPLQVPINDWANEAVIEFKLLADVDKVAYNSSPQQLFVNSSYNNVRGLYKRLHGRDCADRPSYQNAAEVYLYYMEDAGSWTFGPDLGGEKAFARFESDATTPLEVKFENEDVVKELRSMPEVDKEILATAPGRLGVKSKYGNITGVYRRVADKDSGGRPAYENVHGTFLFFSELTCSWLFGQKLGSNQFYCQADSDAPIPIEVPLKAWDGNVDELWDLGEIDEDATQNLPQKLGLDCKYCNISGGYVRKDDYEGFPTYHNEPKGKHLWHKPYERQWVLTDAKPGQKGYYSKGKYLKWDSNALDPLQLIGECEFYEVTWRDYEHEGFVDEKFPPEASSLGVERDHEVQWIRASDLDREFHAVLWNGIKPNNLMQGAVGNCWLLAAISCLAALHPDILEGLFMTGDKVQAAGRYAIRLYNVLDSDWQNLEIDDLIPCRKREWFEKRAKPISAHPYKNEIWLLLLEKAFAKFVGSWGSLEGGDVTWALQAITGSESCWSFRKNCGDWFRYDNDLDRQKEQIKQGNKRAMAFFGGRETVTLSELFEHIAGNFNQRYLMSCSLTSDEKPESPRKSLRASFVDTLRRQSKRSSRSTPSPRKSMAQRAGDAVRGILGRADTEGERKSFVDKSTSKRKPSSKRKSLFQGLSEWTSGEKKLSLELAEPDKEEVERDQKVRADGLINDHAYSVTNVVEQDSLRLVQLQNPWGDGHEWNGAWSDYSSEWDAYPELKRCLRPERRESVRGMEDGSFWMSFEDFFNTFNHISVCALKVPASP